MAQKPRNFPIWFQGTRPMIIISNTTPSSNAPVEILSKDIRKTTGTANPTMSLKAFLCAPFSRCVCANIKATDMITAPFANSEGWNLKMPKSIQRWAPFVVAPMTPTSKREKTLTGYKKMGNARKKRQGMEWKKMTTIVPTARNMAWLVSGIQKLPFLYANELPALYTSTKEMTQRKKYIIQMTGSPLKRFLILFTFCND